MKKSTFSTAVDSRKTIKLAVHAITEPSKICESPYDIDAFVNKWSKNPLLLDGFISQFMRSTRTKGWKPLFLVLEVDKKIVGTVPLMIKNRLGMRYAEFFPDDWFSPDFVVDDQYRTACVECVFEYLFKTLNCKFVKFYLPEESPNVQTIKQSCKIHRIGFSVWNQSRHCFIPVDCTWSEFQRKKGRQRIIRQIERKLDDIDTWRIEYIENVTGHPDALEKILDVEKRSWKQSLNNYMRDTNYEEILMTWKGSEIETRTKADFKASVWFLYVKNEVVAYTFVIRYKGTAFVIKTSYDKRYVRLYVGKYINHIAIRDMFNEGQISTIDFMAAYPFMSFWSSFSLSHVGLFMWNGDLAALLRASSSNTLFLRIWNRLLDSLQYERKVY